MTEGIDPVVELNKRLTTITQSELARQAKVPQGYISQATRREKPVGPRLLKALGLERVTIYRRLSR